MRALTIAATGMSAQQLHVEVIANNIANINTTAFKRARAEFTDLLYQAERLQGASNRGGDNIVPEGAQVGLGVRTSAIRNLHVQGSLASTGNKLDLAMTGRGWFQITDATGENLYTRAGAFSKNANGQLVNGDGYQLVPAITIPAAATDILVSETGVVSVRLDTQTALQQVGQLTIANFANVQGLKAIGDARYVASPDSGAAITGEAGRNGLGSVRSGSLERSNVDLTAELVGLIAAQRNFQANAKAMETDSTLLQTIINLRQ